MLVDVLPPEAAVAPVNDSQAAAVTHSHGVIAALLFGFEEAHGDKAASLQAQHQDDPSDETGHVKLGLGELCAGAAVTWGV